ncbi:UDP-N-acetylmuramoyl-L-alanyl-D-glutamate--2,6-diaminopimelate ligase [Oceanobacillus profundus]|uniref:UDP-N-acetylmuramoyl-L-alanyl-D-glutamate--2, 6-diaminopimelate ligase n=1 Tax=Oceanobacillus profundus TaxID=372463 RepID=UPI000BA79446|nr:UDP-N-acetylmuramoyl-L-alanyl-D-glutamate--2,6-diaminopimelate ligase [Oceanobacillus profundus]MCM3397314.1 UDP-N-acetylmuramoyl-L-alanyl-D-glutamate--2,6-diaminopimelate ligase [Oceanobacillus profundus]PAE28566.1 UDP-N-acetylmuramoyl-L-alanyl-D-glutamate--2,6-diaminopimelate ligase [Paenibacillus sp. 7884-2]
MLLTSIIQGMQFDIVQGDLNKDIKAIAYDSRNVTKDGIFVAISGFQFDGHAFIHNAIKQGASVIISEKAITVDKGVTVLKVANSRNALANVSSNFYNNPTENLNLIGITGTNGKTSTTYFVKSIYEEARKSIALIGTLGTVMNNKVVKNKNTTPMSLDLQYFFSEMVTEKIDNCIMEASSHAISLQRVAYSKFNTAIFTNLSPDHLELHKNMEEYFGEKAKLFKMTSDYNIINADDYYGQQLIEMVKNDNPKLITYGIHSKADICATDIHYAFDHTLYTVNTPTGSVRIKVNLPGDIYVLNSLAAIACAYSNGIPLEVIQSGINNIKTIQGRFEVIYEKDDFKVIVDFAHTEDALQKTLSIMRPFVKGKIILVFGVYADTSENGTEKRQGMGRVAAEFADFSIVTLDNPKQHNPSIMINETTEAIIRNNGDFEAIPDREKAIQHAIRISKDNDMIVIAGKGHETTQIIGDTEIPFNEKEIILDALAEKVSL